MFEYLMPMLLMPSVGGTLLDRSCRVAVRQQNPLRPASGVPWASPKVAAV